MGLYRYMAAGKGTPPRELLIEADSPREALAKLRGRNLYAVAFLGEADSNGRSLFQWHSTRVDTEDFTRQLVPLLESSIPLEKAMGIIAEGASSPDQKDFVNSLRQGLHEGKRFSDLIRSCGSRFPGYYANLIESGEESGCLPQVTAKLADFMEESRSLKNFIISSSVYPAAILGIVIVVVVVLFTVFVPRFARIFADMGRELPGAMKFLMSSSTFFSYAWWGIPCLIFLLWSIACHVYGREKVKNQCSAWLIQLPLIGRILIDLEVCKYLQTLAILVGNHVEIIRTVRIAGKVIRNPEIAGAFEGIDRKLKSGDKLSMVFANNPYLPRATGPMLRIGEESGTVEAMLRRMAANLENDTRQKIKRLLSLFEPIMIITLAAIVMVVVLAIFMAMMDLNSINSTGGKL